MAQFNPQVPQDTPREYLDYSRGIGTNKTWETLFSGAADVLSSGVKAVDQSIQQGIYDDAHNQVDKIRSVFGVDAAVQTTTNLPTEVKAGQDYLSKLKAAYNNGSVSETYYNAKLETVVKNLRNKYPGYTEQIDNTIRAITGVDPANAIVNSIQAEAKAEAAQRDAAANRWNAYLNANEEYIGIALPDFWQNPDKYSQTEVHAAVTKIKADSELSKLRAANVALQISQGQLDDRNLERSARSSVTDYATNVMNGGLGAIGKTYQDINTKLNAAALNPASLSPEEQSNLLAGAGALKKQITDGVTSMLMSPLDPTNPDSPNYWEHLSDDKRKDILAQATAPVDSMIDALVNKDYGMLNASAASIKAMQDQDTKIFLQRNSFAGRLAAAKTVLGEQGMNLMLTTHQELLSPIVESLKNWANTGAILGDTTATDTFKTLSAETDDPKVYTNHLNDAVTLLTNPKATPQQIDNVTTYLFSDANKDFLNVFKTNEQKMGVYNQLTSPLVTERMVSHAKTNPQAWNNYSTWAYSNFINLEKNTAAEVQTGIVNRKYLDIGFDPNRLRFTVQDKTPAGSFFTADLYGPERVLNQSALNGIRRLNAGLDSIVPILKASGADPGQHVLEAFAAMGVNPNAIKEGPLLDQLYRAVADAVTPKTTEGMGDKAREVYLKNKPAIDKLLQNMANPANDDTGFWDQFNQLNQNYPEK